MAKLYDPFSCPPRYHLSFDAVYLKLLGNNNRVPNQYSKYLTQIIDIVEVDDGEW